MRGFCKQETAGVYMFQAMHSPGFNGAWRLFFFGGARQPDFDRAPCIGYVRGGFAMVKSAEDKRRIYG